MPLSTCPQHQLSTFKFTYPSSIIHRHFLISDFYCMSIEFFILLSAIQAENIVTPTKRLLDDLLSRPYKTEVRPTTDSDNATVVTIIPNMFILLEMDQQQETIRFSEEFMLSWIDPVFSWDPAEYPNYTQEWVKMPEDRLWSPGIVFQPSISRQEYIPLDKRMVDLKYDGTVRQSNPGVITTPCSLIIADFPYDGNSEWELIDITASSYTSLDPISKKNYTGITYRVTLKRRPVYYVLVIQAPTFIISTLTIFGVFTPFSNTEERREKVTLGVNMFVSISMMLNLVSDMMPKASRLPLLGNYILAEIFVCGSAVIVSLGIHTMHEKVHSRVISPPIWLRRVLLCECKKREIKPAPDIRLIHTTPDIVPFTVLQDSVHKTCESIKMAITRLRIEAEVRLQWMLLFDRLDFYLLILFQAFNIIVSVLFMR